MIFAITTKSFLEVVVAPLKPPNFSHSIPSGISSGNWEALWTLSNVLDNSGQPELLLWLAGFFDRAAEQVCNSSPFRAKDELWN